MFNEPLSHYEVQQFNRTQHLEVDAKLKTAREDNGIATGRLWLKARSEMSSAEYKALMLAAGRHPLTIAGFIREAQKADGVLPTPVRHRAKRFELDIQEVFALLDKSNDLDHAKQLLQEALDEAQSK